MTNIINHRLCELLQRKLQPIEEPVTSKNNEEDNSCNAETDLSAAKNKPENASVSSSLCLGSLDSASTNAASSTARELDDRRAEKHLRKSSGKQRKEKSADLFNLSMSSIESNETVEPSRQNNDENQQQPARSSPSNLTPNEIFQRMTSVLGIIAPLECFMKSFKMNFRILSKVAADQNKIAEMSIQDEYEFYRKIYDYPYFEKEGFREGFHKD